MKQIDIICNDKQYTRLLCLELEARGYRAEPRNTGRADLILCEKGTAVQDNCITFSRDGDADLVRPFDIEELIALIEERTDGEGHKSTEEELWVSTSSRCAAYRGTRIAFSELEHRLLLCLYEKRNSCVSCAELAGELFGDPGAENPVRVYISYLRNKLDEAFGVKFIYTARGKGYILKV